MSKSADVSTSETQGSLRRNERQILDVLRRGPCSRTELAQATGLSQAAISVLVKDLEQRGWLSSASGDETRQAGVLGRPPVPVRLISDRVLTLGVVVERRSVALGLVDLAGHVLTRSPAMTSTAPERDAILACLDTALSTFLGRLSSEERARVTGIGVSVPGTVNARGVAVRCSAIAGWVDVALRDTLERTYGLPTRVENSSRAWALAEQRFDATGGFEDALYLEIGEGVGAGIVVGGRILLGADSLAGEIGHTVMDEDGPLCSCGNHGCLETLVSERGLLSGVRQRLKQGVYSALAALPDGALTLSALIAAGEMGDKLAAVMWEETGNYLGRALCHAVNLLNPRAIILCGSVAAAADLLTNPIRRRLKASALPESTAYLQVLPSSLGTDGALLAAAAALDSLYVASGV